MQYGSFGEAEYFVEEASVGSNIAPGNAPVQLLGLCRNDDGKTKCLDCGKLFTQPHNAKVHHREMHRQSKGEEHKCPLCGKVYFIKRYLNNHLLEAHKITQKMLKGSYVPQY